ncbi:MAG TPA: S1 RNA-binding domain-containing protein [Patescibacteria group bacterium]|nr:S1 RNA-binding domain-containing protein [Patescibacteria group bacterium]
MANSTGKATSMAELMARQGSSFQVLTKGQIVEGTIKKLTSQEILMDIGAKGDALVIEYDKQNMENLLAFLKVGDKVKASVISPESEEGFPVLSLRRTLDDIIFAKFENISKKDEAFEVEILEATRGGYFAQTDEGIRGFMPTSQATEEDLVGKKVMVKILEFDRAKKRVVFSQKAVDFVTSPAAIGKYIKRGVAMDGVVSSVSPYGLYVVLNPEKDVKIEGFVHISEIAYEHVSDLASKYKIGDKIKAEVIEVDEGNRRVNLSIKKTLKDTFQDVREKYKVEDKVTGTVSDVKSRGVTVELPDGLKGMIPSDKVPSGTTYKVGDSVNCEVVDFDDRRRTITLSPILKAVPIGYR